MSISYHPEDELLSEYASGALNGSISLCVSVHLEYCSECRNTVRKLEMLGGELLADIEPQPVGDELFDTIMAKIDAGADTSAGRVNLSLESQQLPSAVNKLIAYDQNNLDWKNHGRHVKTAKLMRDGGVDTSLIRINKSAKIPTHSHRGNEYTLVLSGSFSDNGGVYRPGDFIVSDGDIEHSPVATSDTDCICLAAIDAPLYFKNPLMELYNRVVPM